MYHTKLSPVFLSFALSLCIGCGDGGPANYKLSGTITYRGKPVQAGEVFLRPVGNGPGGFGFIKDGKYETIKGKGFQGGKSKVSFHGFKKNDGADPMSSNGGNLFNEYVVELDLPNENFTYDVEVPAKRR